MPETLTVRRWFRLQRAAQWRRDQSALHDCQAVVDLIARGFTAQQWVLPGRDQYVERGASDLFIEHAHDTATRKLARLIYDLRGAPCPHYWERNRVRGPGMSAPFSYTYGFDWGPK